MKIESFGSKHVGVVLKGNPKEETELESFSIFFPGGIATVTRATDGAGGDYWVHIVRNDQNRLDNAPDTGAVMGFLTDARIDKDDKPTSQIDVGELRDPSVYHVAFRISRTNKAEEI
jgi:hypothetical protein